MKTLDISRKEDMEKLGFSKKSSFPMFTLKTHNLLDYLINVFILISPFLFGFYKIENARNLFLIMGIILLVYNLFTDYFYSLVKYIPFALHRLLDIILGTLLMTAPSSFEYKSDLTTGQLLAHLLLGGSLFVSALFTKTLTLGELGDDVEEEKLAA